MAPGSGDRKDDRDVTAKKYDSDDIDVEKMSTEELSRMTAVNVKWILRDQRDVKEQIGKLVPEAVCEARSRALSSEVRGMQSGIASQVTSEVAKQVPPLLKAEIPPVVKSAVAEVTGMHKLTKLLEQAQRRHTSSENPVVPQSGLGWVKKHPKTAIAIISTVLGLLGTGTVKAAYFIVDLDQAMQRREKTAAAREAETAEALKKVEEKIVPKKEYRYIKVLIPVAPDAGVRRRPRRPRSTRLRPATKVAP